jgi:hyperosmotically inducible protein
MHNRFNGIALIASMIAGAALAACSPGERQEVSSSANQAVQTARNDASRAMEKTERFVDDAALTTKVKSALLADSQVKGTQIDVDSKDGVVTLHGSVSTASEKARAGQLAQNVEGVRSVRNNLAAQ